MTEAATGEPKVQRWTSQRWALDNVLRSVGIDWDQPRSFYLNAACGIEGGADFGAVAVSVRVSISKDYRISRERPTGGVHSK